VFFVSTVGYYMLFNSRRGQMGDRMQLISPLLSISQSSQLQFSYYILRKQSDGGSLLQLFQLSTLGIRVQLLFENSMSPDSSWQQATICLPSGSYFLAFEATMGNPLLSDITLDNIRVSTNQPCLLAASKSTISSKNGKRTKIAES